MLTNAVRKWRRKGEREENESTDKEIRVQQRENWNDFSLWDIIYSAHRGRRWDIIRSASSGVGGENFSSGGTLGCVERAGCATSSVGWKSGTNFALERNSKKRNENFYFFRHSTNMDEVVRMGKKGRNIYLFSFFFIFSTKSGRQGSEGRVSDNLWSPCLHFALFTFGGTKKKINLHFRLWRAAR